MKHGIDKSTEGQQPISFEVPADELRPDPETLPDGGFARIYVLEVWSKDGGWWPGDTFTPYAYRAAEQLQDLRARGAKARVVAYVQEQVQVAKTSSSTGSRK
jgi:hypothetical protein